MSEANSQIYYRLELNNFEPGKAKISIVIKENLNGSERAINRQLIK